jgi:hypothetical protein
MIKSILLIMMIPALPLFALSIIPEYWGKIYFYWGLAFTILSFVLTLLLVRKSIANQSKDLSIRKFFFCGLFAWLLSIVVLALINLSPLCLGQNNGDGTNSFDMCILLTFIWLVLMSLFVLPLIYFSSWLSVRVFRRHGSHA